MRIAVLDDYQQAAAGLADWSALDADTRFFTHHIPDPDRLVTELSGFDVVVAMRERTPFPRSVLERLSDLRLLVTTGRRNSAIDTASAADLGIVVSGTESLPHPTAELTMALLLALARDLPAEIESVRRGGWQLGVGRDLVGSTLGIVGLGRLGSRMAKLATAFEMNVIAWSQNLTPERATDVGATAVSKPDLFQQADFVTIHLRLSERTTGLVGRAELELMRPGAFLINTSRGPIVDEPALLDAVRAGRIAGAALDVFDQEPLPADHPFRSEPRILTTPHLGYVTEDNYRAYYQGAVSAIDAWRRGQPINILT